MAQGGRDKSGGGTSSKGPSGRVRSGKGASRKGSAAARGSIAAARRSRGGRTQFVIGGVAVLVIVAIIVVGLVLHSRSTATQGAGYGTSTKSVATVDSAGTITVGNGDPSLVLDFYEDALCPICAELEHQFGQQIAQAVDSGQLAARYRMVDFLNGSSHSGSYSTRAYAALISVAKGDGDKPGVLMSFHAALFDAKNQPKESGATDLSNQQLADLAGTVGASKATQQQIAAGADVADASTAAQANYDALAAASAKVGIDRPGTPTVVNDGIPVSTASTDWLTNLLPADAVPSSAPTS